VRRRWRWRTERVSRPLHPSPLPLLPPRRQPNRERPFPSLLGSDGVGGGRSVAPRCRGSRRCRGGGGDGASLARTYNLSRHGASSRSSRSAAARLALDSKVVCLPSRCPAPGLLGGDAFSAGIPTTRDFYTNAGQMRGEGAAAAAPEKLGYISKSEKCRGQKFFFQLRQHDVTGKSVAVLDN